MATAKVQQVSTQTPMQKELMKLIQEGLLKGEGAFKDLLGGFNMEEFEQGVTQPALKHFQDTVLPMLQEKYAASNQAGSSGAKRAEARAGTDLQSQLAQLLYQAQQQQKGNQLAGLQTALGTQGFENVVTQPAAKKPSIFSQVAPAIGTAVGSLGGPLGAAAGGAIGTAASKYIAG